MIRVKYRECQSLGQAGADGSGMAIMRRLLFAPMNPRPAAVADASLDFALLQKSVSGHAGRNRVALLWLLGLLVLLLSAVVSLVLYLNNFEEEEAARRRAADAQWLEQSVQFHFRRLEDDLLVLARQAVLQKMCIRDSFQAVNVAVVMVGQFAGFDEAHQHLQKAKTHQAGA